MPLRTVRVGFALLLSVACAASADHLFANPSPADISNGALAFADRVAYQRAIEEVYWRHRLWPMENPGSKPSLDALISQAGLENKVRDYLRKSQALEDYWQLPITAGQLQAEMDRMASSTKQPEVLRELFAALGNDPFVIAECIARPALSERLLNNMYGYNERIHAELRQRAEGELRAHPTVRLMKQLSGEYGEIELIRSDSDGLKNVGSIGRRKKLTSPEWEATVKKLAATFRRDGASSSRSQARGQIGAGLAGAYEVIPVGKLSALQEEETYFFVTAIIEKSADRLKLATVAWSKESLDSWITNAENEISETMVTPIVAYRLSRISGRVDGCDDTWMSTAILSPGRVRHTAVWTGNEMIVWGGEVSTNVLSNTGEIYTPSTDSWTPTSTVNAPSARADHTTVWTGTEMIVWGGDTPGAWVNTGGRYNPGMDSWIFTNTITAPHGRENQTAVWTGKEMIVWGGYYQEPAATDHYVNTGGRYNPNTDNWTATNTINAPDGRDSHTAIWTGDQMIVWGGAVANSQWVNTGGRYNAATDSWIMTSLVNVPFARAYHKAVWSGTEMIVWGGYTFSGQTDTGGKYNPSSDSWTATSNTNSPTKRYDLNAVWTGTEMIVWGGYGCTDQFCQTVTYLNTGARYSPSTNSWNATTMTNAPPRREGHTAVWTGNEMIVWGGFSFDGQSFNYLNTGGRYCAQPSTPTVQSAVSRKSHGNTGNFDVDLPLTGRPGVECRSGSANSDYTIVLTFLANVSVNGNPQATVTSGIGTIGSGGVNNGGMVVTSGNVVTIPLTNVTNAQAINVTLNNVNASTNVMIPMRVLIGDVNGNGSVNATDVSQCKLDVGQSVSASDFRSDVNAGGAINATDVSVVKSKVGTALP